MMHDDSHDALVLELVRLTAKVGQLRAALTLMLQRIERLESEAQVQRLKRRQPYETTATGAYDWAR